jgi:hypothetical protein
MKLERIETPDYILAVSDEKPTVGNQFIYETDTQTINTTCSDYTPNEFDFIIKAHQPKGNVKELDLPLLPEMVVGDDVEKLPNFLYKNEYGCILSGVDGDSDVTNEWNNYKAATKVYSEEDLRRAIEFTVQNVLQAIPGITSTKTITESFIQSLKQPKWFIAEMDYLSDTGEWKHVLLPSEWKTDTQTRLKTTTTNGKTYLVGTYK